MPSYAVRTVAAGLLVAFLLFPGGVSAAQDGEGTQKLSTQQEPTPNEPKLSEVIPLVTALSARLADLEIVLQGVPDVAPIEEEYATIETRIGKIAKQLEKLKDAAGENSARFSKFKEELADANELLREANHPLGEAIHRLDDLDREWLTQRVRWDRWKAALSVDRSSSHLDSALATAVATIETARGLVSRHIETLLAVQAKGGALESRIGAFNAEVRALIAAARQGLLLGKSPPMYSLLYFSPFNRELWNATREGIDLLSWPSSRFFLQHGFAFGLLLLLFVVTYAGICRNRQALKESELWRFVAERPVSTSLFACALIGVVQLEFWTAPATITLICMLIGGISCVRILGSVLGQQWKRHAAYSFMSFHLLTLIFVAIDLPLPTTRLYIVATSLLAIKFCLRWAQENVRLEESIYYTWGL